MDELRDRMLRGNLVEDVRRLLRSGAEDHARWIRDNVRQAITARRQDAVSISALTGLAPGTVRGFLNGRPSSIDNVLVIAQATGYTLAELDQPPDEFRLRLDGLHGGVDSGGVGGCLAAVPGIPPPPRGFLEGGDEI